MGHVFQVACRVGASGKLKPFITSDSTLYLGYLPAGLHVTTLAAFIVPLKGPETDRYRRVNEAATATPSRSTSTVNQSDDTRRQASSIHGGLAWITEIPGTFAATPATGGTYTAPEIVPSRSVRTAQLQVDFHFFRRVDFQITQTGNCTYFFEFFERDLEGRLTPVWYRFLRNPGEIRKIVKPFISGVLWTHFLTSFFHFSRQAKFATRQSDF